MVTVLVHVFGLGLIRQRTNRFSGRYLQRHHPTAAVVIVMGASTLLATSLHGIEAGIWGAAYQLLGALPDNKSAMLYSLNAITSYGHTSLSLEQRWHLMGTPEALNGWLLFGLTHRLPVWHASDSLAVRQQWRAAVAVRHNLV
jgi:hypothetical protein